MTTPARTPEESSVMTCPEGDEVEVSWVKGERAEEWICPPCRERSLAKHRAAAKNPADYRDAAALAEADARYSFEASK